MSPLLLVATGLLLGALGALAHLLVVAWRVGLLTRGAPRRARLAWPLGLLGPAAAVLLAASLAAPAAWSALVGLTLTRWLVLSGRGSQA